MSARQNLILDLMLAFLCGIAVYYGFVKMNFWVYLGAGILLWLVFKNVGSKKNQIVLIVLLFILGLGRGALDNLKKDISFLDGQKISFRGSVVFINPSSRSQSELRVDAIEIDDGKNISKMEFLARMTISSFENFKIGQKVEVSGTLAARDKLEDDSFWPYLYKERVDFNVYSPRISKLSTDYNWGDSFFNLLNDWKKKLVAFYRQNLSANTAAFVIGILIGQRADFSKEVLNNFAKTGLSHVLAISGFNIALIIGVLEKFLEKKMKKKSRFILMGVMVGVFTFFTGASASVVRAALMGMISLLVKYNGRQNDATVVLFITVVMMSLVNPRILDYDVGFQLSFLATLGLLVYMPKFQNLNVKFIPESILEIFFSTLSALILTLPVMMINFEQFSLIAFPANLVVLPFVSILMFLGLVLWLSGFLFSGLALFLGQLISFFVEFLMNIVATLARVDFLTINIGSEWQLIWLPYYLLLFMVFHKPKLGQIVWRQYEIPDGSVSIRE